MLYPKINSLWKRDEAHVLIVGDYACEEYNVINSWRVEEKIDGTNIVVAIVDGKPTFHGRTDRAIIPEHLHQYLENHFTPERLAKAFKPEQKICLYGEGYGYKIQTGDNYRTDVGFMLFDVLAGHWWLTREAVHDIGKQLDVPVPPDLGVMSQEAIIKLVQSGPLSQCSRVPCGMEGVVVRSHPLMLHRNGRPVMWKLKVKDFDQLTLCL